MAAPQIQTTDPIDVVIYLASLATDVKTVDPWLDVVRQITARITSTADLTVQDRQALSQLRSKLEEHLIKNDPVRYFTPQTLAQRVEEHFQPGSEKDRAHKLRSMLLRIWAATLTAYMLPIIFLWNIPMQTRLLLGFSLGSVVTVHTGIIWFYLSALKDVRREFKNAFIYISAGIAFTAGSVIQFVFLNILDGWDIPIFRYGGFLGLFTISCFLILIGVGKITRLFGMSDRLAQLRIVIPTTIILAIGIVLMPHHTKVPEEVFYNISRVSIFLCAYYMVLSAILVYRIRRNVTFMYSKALFWFLCMNVMVAVGCLEFSVVLYFRGPVGGLAQMITSSPFLVSSMCMLQSGYTFKRDSK